MIQSREEILGTEKISKLILRLSIPTVIAQLINVLYNIIDRIYIGHMENVGKFALTGIGVTFPIILMISAFSAFVGVGGAPLAAIQLGKNNKEKAERILSNGCMVLIIFSVFLTVSFLIFKQPLLYMFGSSTDTYPYANDFLTIYLVGTIFVQLTLGLNTFISSQGEAKIAMFSVLIGAAINIILDPILIFGFQLGVKGAALANIISQAVSALWVIRFLTSNRSSIRIRLKYLKPDFRIIVGIFALGISPFIMQVTDSAISVVLNRGLQLYGGDLYVASMTIMQSIMQLITIPISGFNQGAQPIISYNYGAAKFDRVKKTFKITISTSFIFLTISSLFIIIFPNLFVRLFTSDEQLVALVTHMIRIFLAGMWIFGIQMGCQSTFLGLGQAKISLFIAMLRKVILMIPLALLLPKFYGVISIYFAEPISDTIAATTCGIIFLFTYKKLLTEKSLGKF